MNISAIRKKAAVKIILGVIGSILAVSASAAEPWVSIEGGYAFAVENSSSHIASMPNEPAPPIYDDYEKKNRDGSFLAGITAGYEYKIRKDTKWFTHTRLGIGYEYVAPSQVDGEVIKYLEEPYYNYKYHMRSSVIWFDAQIDIWKYKMITPFIDVAIGPAITRVGGYAEERINTDVPVRDSADFSDKTNTRFAWRVGAGVDVPLSSDDWVISLVYRYSDLGDVETGDSATYSSVGSLKTPFVNSELLLALRYEF